MSSNLIHSPKSIALQSDCEISSIPSVSISGFFACKCFLVASKELLLFWHWLHRESSELPGHWHGRRVPRNEFQYVSVQKVLNVCEIPVRSLTLAIKHLKDATKAANLICTFCIALACLNDWKRGKTTNKQKTITTVQPCPDAAGSSDSWQVSTKLEFGSRISPSKQIPSWHGKQAGNSKKIETGPGQ